MQLRLTRAVLSTRYTAVPVPVPVPVQGSECVQRPLNCNARESPPNKKINGGAALEHPRTKWDTPRPAQKASSHMSVLLQCRLPSPPFSIPTHCWVPKVLSFSARRRHNNASQGSVWPRKGD